jgi:hypothetical protein
MYKESKCAREILSLQKEDGSWGYFHSLSEPVKLPVTTEQALRRLSVLGYTIDDEPIIKAVSYIADCLESRNQVPDRREKLHDPNIFTDLMLSTWIRRFTKEIGRANDIARVWTHVISSAFICGEYDHAEYAKVYTDTFGIPPRGGRFTDFVNFYQVSLNSDMYDTKTESSVFDYILNHSGGIYYICDGPLSVLPAEFNSKQASRYLGAVELLCSYRNNLDKLEFVSDWLMENRNENGKWSMNSKVADEIYFPLSDSWRRAEIREIDCTYRVQKLLEKIQPCIATSTL